MAPSCGLRGGSVVSPWWARGGSMGLLWWVHDACVVPTRCVRSAFVVAPLWWVHGASIFALWWIDSASMGAR